MTGCGAGVLVVCNGCLYVCWYRYVWSEWLWLYWMGSSTGLGGKNSGEMSGNSSL